MSFKKYARVEILGAGSHRGSWEKSASRKSASFYMQEGGVIDVEAALDSVADAYKISRDPRDYLLLPVRANSADRPNNNLDGWLFEELSRYDDLLGSQVYRTYDLKPHFVNHQASDLRRARGVILDSHLNKMNDADEMTKKAIYEATGKNVDKDVFVELLVAQDMTKDPALAEAYRRGSVDSFSMGCDVAATRCSVCGNLATTDFQLCKHIRGKFSKTPVACSDGSKKVAWEQCIGTVFQEISVVDDPADETALIQEGILKAASSEKFLNRSQLQEIANFVVRNASNLPDSVAAALNSVLLG